MFALKIFWGTPDPVCGVRWQALALVKISGASAPSHRNIVSWKSRFGWVQTHMSYFLDSGRKLTRLISLNAEESFSITCLSDFGYLEWFRRYSQSKSEVV